MIYLPEPAPTSAPLPRFWLEPEPKPATPTPTPTPPPPPRRDWQEVLNEYVIRRKEVTDGMRTKLGPGEDEEEVTRTRRSLLRKMDKEHKERWLEESDRRSKEST